MNKKSKKSITAFFNLDKICLNEYANPKKYNNPGILVALQNRCKAEMRSMYNRTFLDVDELYETPKGETFYKITIHHLEKETRPILPEQAQ
jgi:hypothetical protein